jgi:hypothetical protein
MDVTEAAVMYVLLMLATFVYCWFGERLSQQVRLILIFQMYFTECHAILLLI